MPNPNDNDTRKSLMSIHSVIENSWQDPIGAAVAAWVNSANSKISMIESKRQEICEKANGIKAICERIIDDNNNDGDGSNQKHLGRHR